MNTPSISRISSNIRRLTILGLIIASFSVVAGVWFGYGPSPQYDSDGDGIPDWLELLLGLDPLAANNSTGDVDGDGKFDTADCLLTQEYFSNIRLGKGRIIGCPVSTGSKMEIASLDRDAVFFMVLPPLLHRPRQRNCLQIRWNSLILHKRPSREMMNQHSRSPIQSLILHLIWEACFLHWSLIAWNQG